MLNTYADFISQIEGVYGAYNKAQKVELSIFLPEKVEESDLDKLYWKLREEYSAAFKTPPDLTQINNVLKQSLQSYEAEALYWYGLLTRTGSSLDNVAISDIRAQACIEDFGGWSAFCQRDPESEHFHQAKFVKWFVMYSHTAPERQAKVLKGESTRNKPPIIFGDKEACMNLIEMAENNTGQAMQAIESMTNGMRVQ